MARRAALRLAREGSAQTTHSCDPPCSSEQHSVNSQQPTTDNQKLAAAVARLPQHLGWGSAAQTAVLRTAANRFRNAVQESRERDLSWVEGLRPAAEPAPPSEGEPQFSADGAVPLAPSLGLAILRHKQAAGSRLWLLLRAIDSEGRGVVSLDLARKAFTEVDSPLRFCGRRQLRNLIASGSGLFWEVDDKRIWLRSAVRVAQALGISNFHGQEVAIPLSVLTGGIGAVRANLFTSFHSGRKSKPIARQTLARKSGISPRTQRSYDRLSGVYKQANYARGPKLGSSEAQEMAWQQGPASFTWRETRRRQNGQDSRFLAWQLPNSYYGPHARLGRSRQKRQNKALADLLNKGTAGNGHSQKDDLSPRYFADARAASRTFDRNETAVYWPDLKPGLWHCLWSQKTPDKTILHGKKEA